LNMNAHHDHSDVTVARRITVLGATGSIGRQALDVIRRSRGRLAVRALAAATSVEALAAQVMEFRPVKVAMADPGAASELASRLGRALGGDAPEVLPGEAAVRALAAEPEADVVLNALVGSAGLTPSLAALEAGLVLALANKESLVTAGPLVMAAARARGTLVPVDSEHSSLFRCVRSLGSRGARAVILTASGGAFRDWPLERMKDVTPEMALRHPVWNMGRRVTVDSATMMNKALEVIEAQHLFGLDASKVRVVIHPQAYVHGMVELADGTLLAHVGPPDMRVPIAYALNYPEDPEPLGPAPDLARVGSLQFEEPDPRRFPCLDLGYRAAEEGGTSPAVLNAADEVAVEAFLSGRVAFPEIAELVRRVMDESGVEAVESPEQIFEADARARGAARRLIEG
jgi:1-deoxy-D-xylulose-5-phosphate reductoisomerase